MKTLTFSLIAAVVLSSCSGTTPPTSEPIAAEPLTAATVADLVNEESITMVVSTLSPTGTGADFPLDFTYVIDDENFSMSIAVGDVEDLLAEAPPELSAITDIETFSALFEGETRLVDGVHYTRSSTTGDGWLRIEDSTLRAELLQTIERADPRSLIRDLGFLLSQGEPDGTLLRLPASTLAGPFNSEPFQLLLSLSGSPENSAGIEIAVGDASLQIEIGPGEDEQGAASLAINVDLASDSGPVHAPPAADQSALEGPGTDAPSGDLEALAAELERLSALADPPCADVDVGDDGVLSEELAACLESEGELLAADLIRQLVES